MRRIENMKDLRSERARLKLELSTTEELLQEDFEWIKSELRPVHLAGKFLNHSMNNSDTGYLNAGIRNGIEFLLKSVVLPKSGWLIRTIVPFVLKNMSSNYLANKKPEFFGMLRNWLTKARKSNHNHNPNHSQNHYDQSTVDEMSY